VGSNEVRSQILDDHRRIRSLVAEVEVAARQTRDRRGGFSARLRELGRELYTSLCLHLDLEDVILIGALRAVGSAGEKRADALALEHLEQRELLEYLLKRLDDEAQPVELLVADLLSFASLLRDDMEAEETQVLTDRLLPDDRPGVDSPES